MKQIVKLLALFSVIAPFSAQAIETTAQHAYMVDYTTGAVLLDKDGDTEMVPSSMSKLMTLYITFSRMKEGRLKMDDTLTVSEKAWRMQGSKMFVPINQQVKVEDLLHGIIVQSGNDACIVMAEGIAGSEEAFVAEMNATAKKLGLTHSRFANATGWPDENQKMSAHDLAVLARHMLDDFPEYYPLFSVKEYTYNNIRQFNRDRLLGNDIGVDGLKTGHTDDGGYGITLSAKQGDRRIILVINGLATDNDRVKEGDALLRYGFREFQNKTLVKAGAEIARADVWMGREKTVPLVAANDVVVTVPAGNTDKSTYTLRYNGPLAAPIAKGDKVAELVVAGDGVEQTIPLVAGAGVAKLSGIGKVIANLKDLLGMK